MGNAAMSASEKATVDGLLKAASQTGEKINRQDLVDLLWWCRRRGLLQSSGQLFDVTVWQKIGKEIFETVQQRTKGAKKLTVTYRQVRLTIEQVHADAEIAKALQAAVAYEQEDSLSPEDEATLEDQEFGEEKEKEYAEDEWGDFASPQPPVATPTGFKGAFDDLIPPWNPDLPPPLEPTQVTQSSAPRDEGERGEPSGAKDAEVPMQIEQEDYPDLGTLLTAQQNVMDKILKEMQRIDGGAAKPTRKIAYERAAKAVKEGLENIARQLDKIESGTGRAERLPESKTLSILEEHQRMINEAALTGWNSHNLNTCLKAQFGPQWTLNSREQLDYEQIVNRTNEPGKGMRRLTDPPRDQSFDLARRWRAVLTNAEIMGDLALTPLLSAPIVATPKGPEWRAFEYETINKLQRSILAYGSDNPLVRKQITTFYKYNELIPADIRMLMELLLGGKSYTLFLTKWQERLEEKQLDNLGLADGDPLRIASLDQLMGSGPFRDPQRQAALHPRIRAQSKACALEAFMALPQIGKPTQPYLKIQQGEDEPFLAFVDKVQEAVKAAPNVPAEMKEVMTKEIVVQNANSICRWLIATLNPGATLVQMVELCARAPMEKEAEKARIHAQALAVALKKGPTQGKGDKGPRTNTCYQCGKPGHFKRQCPERPQKVQNGGFNGTCQRCKRK